MSTATDRSGGVQFALTGTYNSMNKGDAAMELATLAELRRTFGACRATVLTPFPDIDRDVYAPVPVVHSSRREVIGLLRTVGWAALMYLTRRSNLVARSRIATDEIRTIADADVMIDLSGDMLTEDSGVLVGISHFLPLLAAHAAGTPYVLLAQSIGPFRRLSPAARWLLRRAAAVTIRETATVAHLEQLGGVDHEVTADMAFLLEPVAPEPGTHDLGSSTVGVSVSSIVEAKVAAQGRDLIGELAPALRHLAERFDANIVVIAHVTGPSEAKDDRILGRRLVDAVGDRATLIDADLSPQELKGIIGSCGLFVGARMHANIAALGSGVPVVALSYSHKTTGIMSTLGQEDRVIDPARVTTTTLSETLEAAMLDREERSRAIASALDGVRASSRKNIEVVAAVVAGLDSTREVRR